MEEIRFCRAKVLTPNGFPRAWLVAVERVPDWSTWASSVWPVLNAALTNDGYVFTFAQANSASQPVGDPPLRHRFAVIKTIQIQLAKSVVFFRIDAGTTRKIER